MQLHCFFFSPTDTWFLGLKAILERKNADYSDISANMPYTVYTVYIDIAYTLKKRMLRWSLRCVYKTIVTKICNTGRKLYWSAINSYYPKGGWHQCTKLLTSLSLLKIKTNRTKCLSFSLPNSNIHQQISISLFLKEKNIIKINKTGSADYLKNLLISQASRKLVPWLADWHTVKKYFLSLKPFPVVPSRYITQLNVTCPVKERN